MKREPTEMELRVSVALRDLAYPTSGARVGAKTLIEQIEARERLVPAASYLEQARAAIRAMREPTAQALDAGVLSFRLQKHPRQAIADSYAAMIDAASPPEGT